MSRTVLRVSQAARVRDAARNRWTSVASLRAIAGAYGLNRQGAARAQRAAASRWPGLSCRAERHRVEDEAIRTLVAWERKYPGIVRMLATKTRHADIARKFRSNTNRGASLSRQRVQQMAAYTRRVACRSLRAPLQTIAERIEARSLLTTDARLRREKLRLQNSGV